MKLALSTIAMNHLFSELFEEVRLSRKRSSGMLRQTRTNDVASVQPLMTVSAKSDQVRTVIIALADSVVAGDGPGGLVGNRKSPRRKQGSKEVRSLSQLCEAM
jgi:hypothetical protein